MRAPATSGVAHRLPLCSEANRAGFGWLDAADVAELNAARADLLPIPGDCGTLNAHCDCELLGGVVVVK